MPEVEVLIPTYNRPGALAVTLASLVGQQMREFDVVISDQSEPGIALDSGEVRAVLRVLSARGHRVQFLRNLPRRGLAHQRQFLLDHSSARYLLFLDDDVILEPEVVGRMYSVLCEDGCGFAGCAVIGLSYLDDVRPHEQEIEFWDGPVEPETVTPDSRMWQRYRLHNAANLYHVQQRLNLAPGEVRKYRVAWVGGCAMYRADALRNAGGFEFWRELPEDHCGEDVLAQLRVMARYGGCGLLPSGVYHQELPTTVRNRNIDAPRILGLDTEPGGFAAK